MFVISRLVTAKYTCTWLPELLFQPICRLGRPESYCFITEKLIFIESRCPRICSIWFWKQNHFWWVLFSLVVIAEITPTPKKLIFNGSQHLKNGKSDFGNQTTFDDHCFLQSSLLGSHPLPLERASRLPQSVYVRLWERTVARRWSHASDNHPKDLLSVSKVALQGGAILR